MKAFLCALLCLCGVGCARIYRPVEVAAMRPAAPGPGLAASVTLQPWGDNSGYEGKALRKHLRVLVLSLENPSQAEVQILRLDLPGGASWLTPEEALGLVKQQPLLFLLYPLIPGLVAAGSSNHASPGSVGPSDKAFFSGLAIVGLAIGIPNAVVAARSNTRLEAFFRARAWAPGSLPPGQARQGLLFLRSKDNTTPVTARLVYRDSAGEQQLELVCPGARAP